MELLSFTKLIISICIVKCFIHNGLASDVCDTDITAEAMTSQFHFGSKLYKAVAEHHNNNFILSANSIWLGLAGMAEGATDDGQEELFQALRLPKEACLRQKYYKFVEEAAPKLRNVIEPRWLALDEALNLNQTWADGVKSAGLLSTVSLPLKNNPTYAAEQLSNLVNMKPGDIHLSDKSLILETLNFHGKWAKLAPGAKIERNAPFYDEHGREIARVDMVRFKKRVKMTYLPKINAKVLQLSVSDDPRYFILALLPIDNSTSLDSCVAGIDTKTVKYTFDNARESTAPIDVAIPVFSLTMYHNMRPLLEKLGIMILWRDPTGSEYVADPAPIPSGYYQHVTVGLDAEGLEDYQDEEQNSEQAEDIRVNTGLPKEVGAGFIANRPFLFSFNEDHRLLIFAGGYTGKATA